MPRPGMNGFGSGRHKIKYLEEQIIALQVYGSYLKEGYNIMQGGLSHS